MTIKTDETKKVINEEVLNSLLKEVCSALLEADVNIKLGLVSFTSPSLMSAGLWTI